MARKKKNYSLPNYLASEEENKAYRYCVRNNIRISYKGIQDDEDHWRIEVRLGPYVKGEKTYVSPEIYDRKKVNTTYYKIILEYHTKEYKMMRIIGVLKLDWALM